MTGSYRDVRLNIFPEFFQSLAELVPRRVAGFCRTKKAPARYQTSRNIDVSFRCFLQQLLCMYACLSIQLCIAICVYRYLAN